jgi:arylformamidase
VWTCKKSEGATVNLSEIRLSVHTGTHIDAPYHFKDSGKSVADLPIVPFFGPARVLDMRGHAHINKSDLEGHAVSGTPRLLFRTDAWTDKMQFPLRVPTLAEDVPALLAQEGVILVGVDVPSVDAIDSKDLPIHHALAAHGIHILESLDLSGVPEGVYELAALPLRIVGADGAPVRAILREIGPE